jgi:hypothetical protein
MRNQAGEERHGEPVVDRCHDFLIFPQSQVGLGMGLNGIA